MTKASMSRVQLNDKSETMKKKIKEIKQDRDRSRSKSRSKSRSRSPRSGRK